jgi:hypothetical protein
MRLDEVVQLREQSGNFVVRLVDASGKPVEEHSAPDAARAGKLVADILSAGLDTGMTVEVSGT